MQTANTKVKTKQFTNNARALGTLTTYGRGIVSGNPKQCLKCQMPIRNGEAWTKHTSAPDGEHSRYSIIIHAHCEQHHGKH